MVCAAPQAPKPSPYNGAGTRGRICDRSKGLSPSLNPEGDTRMSSNGRMEAVTELPPNNTDAESPNCRTMDLGSDDGKHDDDQSLNSWQDDSSIPTQKLSCTQCRRRKVKCDRVNPCTPCIRKSIDCSFPTGFRARPKRQHALLSSTYKDKIDEISRKLDRVCLAVDAIGTSPAPGAKSRSFATAGAATPSTNYDTSPSSWNRSKGEDDGLAREEQSTELGLTAHAAFANDYIHYAIGNAHVNPELSTSLKALRNALHAESEGSPFRHALDAESPAQGSPVELPPLQLSISCLEKAKDWPRLKYFWGWDLYSTGQVTEYVLRVYSGEPSLADMITFYACMGCLFIEFRDQSPEAAQKEILDEQAQLCQQRLADALARLPFDLPASFDYVLALYQGACHFMDHCKPFKAWKYLAGSSQMIQTLGYDRDVALAPETKERKKRRVKLVWMIVILEKALSLRLGRPSTFRTCDLTLPRTWLDDDDDSAPMPLDKWLSWSLSMGNIYDELFSSGALLQPESTRGMRSCAHAIELQQAYEAHSSEEAAYLQERRNLFGNDLGELFERADKILHLCTLTLLYRAVPAGPYSRSAFCGECIVTAHAALDEHARCMVLLRNIDGTIVKLYIQWAILSFPFVPFIVLFCRVVETCDSSHLPKLAAVVDTLQLLPEELPVGYRKALAIFKIMYEVACRYVEAGPRGVFNQPLLQSQQSSLLTSSLDALLRDASAGNVEQGSWPHVIRPDDNGDLGAIGDAFGQRPDSQGAGLGSWLDHSHQMFRMLDDDLQGAGS